jgi:hypothetical protein
MWWPLIVIVLGAVAFVVVLAIAEHARLLKLLDRPCAGIRWHRRFPSVPHDEIRKFLKLFTVAFAFDERHYSKFGPDDQPWAIYHARYIPHLTVDDHMEFESLIEAFAKTYGVDLWAVWHDEMTLGELFALAVGNSRSER